MKDKATDDWVSLPVGRDKIMFEEIEYYARKIAKPHLRSMVSISRGKLKDHIVDAAVFGIRIGQQDLQRQHNETKSVALSELDSIKSRITMMFAVKGGVNEQYKNEAIAILDSIKEILK